MATALEIITDALEELGYKAAEVPIEAADVEVGLRKLNDMLAEWADSGLNLGAAPVKLPADTVRIARGAVGPVKSNLAGRLAASFQRPITPELSATISASNKALLRMVVKPINVSFPGTLPTGSGNQTNDFDTDNRFFAQNEKENF